MIISGTIELVVDETEVLVTYNYFPAERMTRHYPGCAAEVEVVSCLDILERDREDLADKLMKSDYLIEKVEEDLADANDNRY